MSTDETPNVDAPPGKGGRTTRTSVDDVDDDDESQPKSIRKLQRQNSDLEKILNETRQELETVKSSLEKFVSAPKVKGLWAEFCDNWDDAFGLR